MEEELDEWTSDNNVGDDVNNGNYDGDGKEEYVRTSFVTPKKRSSTSDDKNSSSNHHFGDKQEKQRSAQQSTSTQQSPITATAPRNDHDNEDVDVDDDEVKFLLTILPPSPKKSKTKSMSTPEPESIMLMMSKEDDNDKNNNICTTPASKVPSSSAMLPSMSAVVSTTKKPFTSSQSHFSSPGIIQRKNFSTATTSTSSFSSPTRPTPVTIDLLSPSSAATTNSFSSSPKINPYSAIESVQTKIGLDIKSSGSETTTSTNVAADIDDNDEKNIDNESLRRALWQTPEKDGRTNDSPSTYFDSQQAVGSKIQPKQQQQYQPTSKEGQQKQQQPQQQQLFSSSFFSNPSNSAYLQTLAEICHTILWDQRWRVKPNENKANKLNHTQQPQPQQQQRLLAWERGEDLSAVLALSKCYQQNNNNHEAPSPAPAPVEDDVDADKFDDTSRDRALDLYSRMYFRKGPWFRSDDLFKYYLPKKKLLYSGDDDDDVDARINSIDESHTSNTNIPTTIKQSSSSTTATATTPPKSTAATFFMPISEKKRSLCNDDDDDGRDEHEQQPLKKKAKGSHPHQNGNHDDHDHPSTTTATAAAAAAAAAQEVPNNRRTPRIQLLNNHHRYIHQHILQQQLDAISLLFDDVIRLHRMGLIRSFYNEKECGQTVGGAGAGGSRTTLQHQHQQQQKMRKKRYHGLLRQDEQRIVLTKLGGGGKNSSARSNKKTPPPNSIGGGGGRSHCNGGNRMYNGYPQKVNSYHENLIWKQMCQQKPIFFSSSSSSSSSPSFSTKEKEYKETDATTKTKTTTKLIEKRSKVTKRSLIYLPVSKHVYQVLIDSWSTSIVLKSSKVSFVPSAILRKVTSSVREVLLQIIHNRQKLRHDDGRGAGTFKQNLLSLLCIRLREKPLISLRRICRLYVCATCGPGDMRCDGTNGWRALPYEEQEANDDIDDGVDEINNNGSNEKKNVHDFDDVDDTDHDYQLYLSSTLSNYMTNNIPPPGSCCWNTITYPGKDYRFKLISCNFQRMYQSYNYIDIDNYNCNTSTRKQQQNDDDNTIQIFSSIHSFHNWELCVELRHTVDYLLELNDLIQYNKRKWIKENGIAATNKNDGNSSKGNCDDDGHNDDNDDEDEDEDDDDNRSNVSHGSVTGHASERIVRSSLDSFNLLNSHGRVVLINRMVLANTGYLTTTSSTKTAAATAAAAVDALKDNVERDVSKLLGTSYIGRCNNDPDHDEDDVVVQNVVMSTDNTRLTNSCEKILCVMAVIGTYVLEYRYRTASYDDVRAIAQRPWLRHMWWEGCLSYMIWDILPILEKRGYYDIATKVLEILLFGCILPRKSRYSSVVPATLVVSSTPIVDSSSYTSSRRGSISILAQNLLSRRARGKAYERLMIDYVHMIRQEQKGIKNQCGNKNNGKSNNQSGKKQKKKNASSSASSPSYAAITMTATDITNILCQELLQSCVGTGQITFAATRSLAKRLKQPLWETLSSLSTLKSYEVHELGHRLSNIPSVKGSKARAGGALVLMDDDDSKNKVSQHGPKKGNKGTGRAKNGIPKKYDDWTPKTDFAVANAMGLSSGEENGNGSSSMTGRRCSYVGFEEGQREAYSSLNVEQLAMEFYHTGRLPVVDDVIDDENDKATRTIDKSKVVISENTSSGGKNNDNNFNNNNTENKKHTYTASVKGGWVGWHDEGGKIRALFRILSSAPILGMDWGYSCCCDNDDDNDMTRKRSIDETELATIHLTPYQSAPFDLHVGAELYYPDSHDDNNHRRHNHDQHDQACHVTIYNGTMIPRRSFYERRKKQIEQFLNHLSKLKPNEVSDLVYQSIYRRMVYAVTGGENTVKPAAAAVTSPTTNNHHHPTTSSTSSMSYSSDPNLERDIQQVRTLSMLAAGFGGVMLSSIFRCFFFDYRHYSGGLPDLTLVRAIYSDDSNDHEKEEQLRRQKQRHVDVAAQEEEEETEQQQQQESPQELKGSNRIVDLGEWIGEAFSKDIQDEEQARRAASMFEDRDEEFLGCSKVGDSGGRATNRFGRSSRNQQRPNSRQRQQQQQQQQQGGGDREAETESSASNELTLPPKLEFEHNGRTIHVECMVVEVKSQNDRLDPRQEDWLNILDKYGNARVCKFGKKQKPKK